MEFAVFLCCSPVDTTLISDGGGFDVLQHCIGNLVDTVVVGIVLSTVILLLLLFIVLHRDTMAFFEKKPIYSFVLYFSFLFLFFFFGLVWFGFCFMILSRFGCFYCQFCSILYV